MALYKEVEDKDMLDATNVIKSLSLACDKVVLSL